MRFALLLLTSAIAFAAGWDDVRRIAPEQKIEVTTRDGSVLHARFVSASDETLALREKTTDRSVPRADVVKLRVADPARRLRSGLLWTAAGAGAGALAGWAVCVYCANEGHGGKFIGPGVAIGAGLGALGFLSSSYSTVYRSN